MLTLNNFIFNFINSLQITGRAMGTTCAPGYTIIFMAQLKKQHIHKK